ncbi:hypothetical protein [Streptomyces sp. NPDC001604]|uniref:hypothetical protein n=1 Tax=Streptomyces sp. NPDC001604 TaxID=3364593 RepID=UPI0036877E30
MNVEGEVAGNDGHDGLEVLAQSVPLWRARKDLGEDLPLPSAEDARKHRWDSLEAERAEVRRRSGVRRVRPSASPRWPCNACAGHRR